MKRPKIFIACDTDKISEVKRIIAQTRTKKLDIGYKFGLEFFYARGGREFISKIKGKKIFLDLKLNDIPATCSKSLMSLKDLKNINYITLHANAGEETIKAVIKVAKKINSKLKILLVTVLTSISNSSIKKIGYTIPLSKLIKKQTLLAKSCGCHGIVCAGTDLKAIKKIFKGEIVTPGIRLKGDSVGDQKRVMGPKEAFKNGSTALVMGRSIIKGSIKNNISRLIKQLK
ncbi:orotidine-5'-phosphate decarboxylase [Pelagibacterales bacterium SAG-MED28]|nr:orotidine-5'-phosphate decarboxylase [Pelagibacterales bacterium SAG-MED28]